MSSVNEYKIRIQHLEKSEQLYSLLSQILAKKVSINSCESNLLKSLEKAISLQRDEVNRLNKIEHHLKTWDTDLTNSQSSLQGHRKT